MVQRLLGVIGSGQGPGVPSTLAVVGVVVQEHDDPAQHEATSHPQMDQGPNCEAQKVRHGNVDETHIEVNQRSAPGEAKYTPAHAVQGW